MERLKRNNIYLIDRLIGFFIGIGIIVAFELLIMLIYLLQESI